MSEHNGGEAGHDDGAPVPETAVSDRDKAELMAYAGKPYLENS